MAGNRGRVDNMAHYLIVRGSRRLKVNDINTTDAFCWREEFNIGSNNKLGVGSMSTDVSYA